MPSFAFFTVIGIIFIFLALGVLLLLPAEKTPAGVRKKKRPQKGEADENKDWQAVSLKLEKHIYALRSEIEKNQKREKVLERDVMVQKEKYARLQEKLKQERGWQMKEKSDIEKRAKEIRRLRNDFKTMEESLEKEHRERLNGERELRKMQEEMAAMQDLKRSLDAEVLKLKMQGDVYRKDLAELREMNKKLAKKHEDTSWIAKSEYQKLEKQLRAKERELDKLKKVSS